MTAACRQEKVDQEFIKSKCGHNILLDHCILDICLILLIEFGPLSDPLWNNIAKLFACPSITHKDDHFAKKHFEILEPHYKILGRGSHLSF
jgi:hypothetical protein